MKNKLVIFIFTISFLLPCFLPVFLALSTSLEDVSLNPNDYARITDVEYRAVVMDEPGSEGSVHITERLTFDVHAASRSNPFWELWRDLCEDYIDGVKVDYTVKSVKQILEDGTEIVYEESPKLYWDDSDYVSSRLGPGKWYHSDGPYNESAAQYECVFFYIDGVYREELVYEIEYEMHNAALRYGDCSDLYLAMYSGDTIKHLESFKGEILFPDKDMPAEGNYDVYSYGTNDNGFRIRESSTKNPGYYTFYFDLDEDDLQFKPYNEYIEFDLVAYGEDKHIFTEYAPNNWYSHDDVLDEIYEEQEDYAKAPARFRVFKGFVFLIALACAGFTVVRTLNLKQRMSRKHTFYEPTTQIQYYRDIPTDLDPNFAATLVFCKKKAPKDDSGIYSAILLSLARKEYITLQELSGGDVEITIHPGRPKPQPAIIAESTVGVLSENTGISMDANAAVDAPVDTDMTVGAFVDVGVASDASANTNVASEAYTPREPLTLSEQYYFNLLVRHAECRTIRMSTLQSRVSSDYENTDSFVREIEGSVVNIGIQEGYFQKAEYNQPRKQAISAAKRLRIYGILLLTLVNFISYQTRMELAFGAFFLTGIVFIVCSVLRKKQAENFVLLTQFGENEYAKWRALYEFLNSETLMNERSMIELPLWEKYLVYATAFGLSEKVIKAIELHCPDVTYSKVLSNSYCRSGRFRYSGRRFRSAVRSGSSVARSGGGSFGYGGGGRGGGGGGGGH